MTHERLEATVHGRVQGVGFRHFVYQRAQELGLAGYARNRWDGRVEVVAEGERAALEQLLEHLKRGPRAAVVKRVEATWMPATGEFGGFGVHF